MRLGSSRFTKVTLLLLCMSIVAMLIIYGKVGDWQRALAWRQLQQSNAFYQSQSQNFAAQLAAVDGNQAVEGNKEQVKLIVLKFKKTLQQRLHSYPDEVTGWYLLGQVALGEGDKELAIACMRKVRELTAKDDP